MDTATPTATSASASASTLAPAYPAGGGSSPSSAGPFAAGLFLAALAAATLVLVRRRRLAPRLVEVIEQTSLGPKRSLVVARMGGEVFVLGSSEGGIALLATRPAGAVLSTSAPTPAPAAPARRRLPLAGAAVDLVARLGRRAPGRSFDAALSESVEDAELRRKLAEGQRGSVR